MRQHKRLQHGVSTQRQRERRTLGNISTRLAVGTGDNVLIGGFIINGTAPKQVIVRATGPSLTAKGVPNALPDTTLDLFAGNRVAVAANDDRQSDQAADIMATNLQPADSREVEILKTLTSGNSVMFGSRLHPSPGIR